MDYNFESTGALGMTGEGSTVSVHKYMQLQEETEQLLGENRQLKKKVESQKKHIKEEIIQVKGLKKQIKEMQGKLNNIPDRESFE
jgi:cell division septum initiation protein DivIVA